MPGLCWLSTIFQWLSCFGHTSPWHPEAPLVRLARKAFLSALLKDYSLAIATLMVILVMIPNLCLVIVALNACFVNIHTYASPHHKVLFSNAKPSYANFLLLNAPPSPVPTVIKLITLRPNSINFQLNNWKISDIY